MKRVVIPELLDSDAGTPAEIAASLSDLERINRWFGGIATTQSLIELAAPELNKVTVDVLEVAAGVGYVPRLASRRLHEAGLQVQITVLDRAFSHLRNGSGTRMRAVAGDALALPFADASFDLVSCCLFVHHLQPTEIVQFVDEGLRVCRTAVLINDLVRHPLHLGLVYGGLPLFRSRLTHHDAPASVRQAYTPAEIKAILKQTNAARFEICRHFLFRMGVMVWKK